MSVAAQATVSLIHGAKETGAEEQYGADEQRDRSPRADCQHKGIHRRSKPAHERESEACRHEDKTNVDHTARLAALPGHDRDGKRGGGKGAETGRKIKYSRQKWRGRDYGNGK